MKKTILLFLLLLFTPLLVEAYPGQYPWDPLYFEEIKGPFDSLNKQFEKDAAQQNVNQQTESRLKSHYGISNYLDCYENYEPSYARQDLSNPATKASLLRMIEYCLESKQLKEEYTKKWDEECKNLYGPNSKLGSLDMVNKKYNCVCQDGYSIISGKCQQDITCPSNSELIGNNCICKQGFVKDSQGNCKLETSGDAICKRDYGQYAYYAGKMTDKNETICGCVSGYIWKGTTCINVEEKKEICKVNVSYIPGVFPAEHARRMYGPQREAGCDCPENYVWQNDMCIIKDIKKQPEVLGVQIDMTLAERLKGKLLLQVEAQGAIWYVDTNDLHRYSVTWANALPLFRKLSLGITDTDLAKIPVAGTNQTGSTSMRNRLKGKLLLQVQQGGNIWYVDKDGFRHSVTWNNLLPLFQSLSLGITNNDLSKIPVGSLEGF